MNITIRQLNWSHSCCLTFHIHGHADLCSSFSMSLSNRMKHCMLRKLYIVINLRRHLRCEIVAPPGWGWHSKAHRKSQQPPPCRQPQIDTKSVRHLTKAIAALFHAARGMHALYQSRLIGLEREIHLWPGAWANHMSPRNLRILENIKWLCSRPPGNPKAH